jgi:hypothetical protein
MINLIRGILPAANEKAPFARFDPNAPPCSIAIKNFAQIPHLFEKTARQPLTNWLPWAWQQSLAGVGEARYVALDANRNG